MLLVVSCKNGIQEDYPDITVNARLIRSYDSVYHYQDTIKLKTFDIRLSIINKSTKPVSFWMMTCSWQENFIINNDYLSFNGEPCDSNIPKIRHLNPNDSLTYKTSFSKHNFSRYQTTETSKFGLIFIDSTKCADINDYLNIIGDKSKQNKTIWSNPLYLNDRK